MTVAGARSSRQPHAIHRSRPKISNELARGLVSKETVVLRRWEIEKEIHVIKRVDKGRITTVKYSEC